MPFVSEAQRGYFNANRAKLEAQGVNVDEWNAASKGDKLPARARKSPDSKTPTLDYGGMVHKAKSFGG